MACCGFGEKGDIIEDVSAGNDVFITFLDAASDGNCAGLAELYEAEG